MNNDRKMRILIGKWSVSISSLEFPNQNSQFWIIVHLCPAIHEVVQFQIVGRVGEKGSLDEGRGW